MGWRDGSRIHGIDGREWLGRHRNGRVVGLGLLAQLGTTTWAPLRIRGRGGPAAELLRVAASPPIAGVGSWEP
jgi:hypothetical protein